MQALEDLVDAVGEVKALQEHTADADRNSQVEVSAQVRQPPLMGFGIIGRQLLSAHQLSLLRDASPIAQRLGVTEKAHAHVQA